VNISTAKRELRSTEDCLGAGTNGLEVLAKQADTITETLSQLSEMENPYRSQIAELKSQIEEEEKGLEETEKALIEIERRRAAADFWVKGFGEVRLWIIEKALRQFEVEVNNALMTLGLHNWAIMFDVTRETKSGTLAKGFSVFIESPESPEMVPFEVWSGGESQRLKIACEAGLVDLIRHWYGVDVDLEVWDEPSTHLSTEGIEDMLDFLRDRSQCRKVWLVDHQTLDAGHFSSVMTVVKDDTGSRLE
jgi:DNA repair exonuclease SbcCD ATPase subunit